MPIPSDADILAELNSMYDAAVAKKKGEAQALIIIAAEAHKARVIQETSAPDHFEWPETP